MKNRNIEDLKKRYSDHEVIENKKGMKSLTIVLQKVIIPEEFKKDFLIIRKNLEGEHFIVVSFPIKLDKKEKERRAVERKKRDGIKRDKRNNIDFKLNSLDKELNIAITKNDQSKIDTVQKEIVETKKRRQEI